MSTIMAVINFSSIREPSFCLPNMTFAACNMNNRHPPIIKKKYAHSDHPLYDHPPNITKAK